MCMRRESDHEGLYYATGVGSGESVHEDEADVREIDSTISNVGKR